MDWLSFLLSDAPSQGEKLANERPIANELILPSPLAN